MDWSIIIGLLILSGLFAIYKLIERLGDYLDGMIRRVAVDYHRWRRAVGITKRRDEGHDEKQDKVNYDSLEYLRLERNSVRNEIAQIEAEAAFLRRDPTDETQHLYERLKKIRDEIRNHPEYKDEPMPEAVQALLKDDPNSEDAE